MPVPLPIEFYDSRCLGGGRRRRVTRSMAIVYLWDGRMRRGAMSMAIGCLAGGRRRRGARSVAVGFLGGVWRGRGSRSEAADDAVRFVQFLPHFGGGESGVKLPRGFGGRGGGRPGRREVNRRVEGEVKEGIEAIPRFIRLLFDDHVVRIDCEK